MKRSLSVIAALACLQAGAARAADYVFTDITDPNATGSTVASGINDAGQVSGYYTATDHSTQSFTYQGGAYSEIAPTAGSSFQANGISAAGTVVGTLTNGSGAFGVVGGSTVSASGFAGATFLNGISNNGLNSVGYVQDVPNSTTHGFATASGGTTFDIPSSTGTIANGINDLGTIAGEYYDAGGALHGFTLAGSTLNTINAPAAAFGTVVTGIDNNGDLGGYFIDASGDTHGFIDIGGNFVTIDAPGANGLYTVVDGINDNGMIVGAFVDAGTGQTVGFEAAIPEPASLALLGGSLLGFMSLRRRTR
jgi:PEP-CTERM motif